MKKSTANTASRRSGSGPRPAQEVQPRKLGSKGIGEAVLQKLWSYKWLADMYR